MYKTDKIKKPLKIEILKITVAFLFTDALLASGIGFQQDKTRSRYTLDTLKKLRG